MFDRSRGKKISTGKLCKSGSSLEFIENHYKEIENKNTSIADCEEELESLQGDFEEYRNSIEYGEEVSDQLSDRKFPVVTVFWNI